MYRLLTRCTAWIIDLPQIFGYCPHIFCGICLNLTEKSPSYRSVVWETPDGTSFKTTASTLSDTSTKFSVSFFVFPFTWSSNSPAELSSWRRHRTISIVVVWEWCYFSLSCTLHDWVYYYRLYIPPKLNDPAHSIVWWIKYRFYSCWCHSVTRT